MLGVNGPTAGRTKTNPATGVKRKPRDVSSLSKDTYSCKKTDFDTAIPYAKADAWAKFPEFQTLLSGSIAEQQGLDRIMIGFNGTSAAETTDLAANPMLQDVNIGWLQKIRTSAPDRVIEEGVAGSGKVTIGATGDYKTLDGLVFDAIQLLEPWHRKRKDRLSSLTRPCCTRNSSRPSKRCSLQPGRKCRRRNRQQRPPGRPAD